MPKRPAKTQQDVSPKKSKLKVEAANSSEPQDFLSNVAHLRLQTAESVADFKFNKKRVRVISDAKDVPEQNHGIVYWMSRDQRVQDNWAMLFAQRLALKQEVPLHVCFCVVPKFLDATIRQYGFMMKGLREVEQELKELDISFHLLIGYAKDVLPKFIEEHQIGGLVTDFSPLRILSEWVQEVASELPSNVPFCQVDAHNIVPCWEASPKLEYGARTIRPKIHKVLSTYLTQYPPVIKHKHKPKTEPEPNVWDAAMDSLEVDKTVSEIDWAQPGTTAGLFALEDFFENRLRSYEVERNDPNKTALSNLSPWFHFGQISVQRAILTVQPYRRKHSKAAEAFIEESVIRRELADNFCFYNDKYDSVEGTNDWAKTSLQLHAKDKREYVYSKEQLEQSRTHDDLWNAAQIQMVSEGKMHGFLRMYWAKKILEWTESPEKALEIAIFFNDKYSIDGTDPNGYVGCMWSVCGIHDQGWKERPVFGKIRYMNYAGCKRKFDVDQFVRKYKAKKY
ncbi:deoxyribodipyrimidine photo-lyase-like isoform X2 [Anneissia japonica]|nr:deoxyribodipyrimidine photo-lyase-like isoform X2 [Anneissia japonica]XP_033103672.1 deoxyribodipyrimidine photo-lyase-like isoform X2 [Anneissia japonica]XP_033103680.1 deoxyribodipyrimidine photo-lyase-like isoform X2 [Anneissia japonica]